MSQEFLFYGEFISEQGVLPVAHALTTCSWRIELHRSGFDGTLYLRTPPTHPEIHLNMDSGQTKQFLFQGDVDATLERALDLLREFSACLSSRSVIHRVEIYDDAGEMVGYFHHQWPWESRDPILVLK